MNASRQPSASHPRQLREFGLVVGSLVLFLFGWLWPLIHQQPRPLWPFIIAIPLLSLGLLYPQALIWPYKGWMRLGHALGWINSHIVLGLVFIAVLQPIALAMKLLKHDPLKRKYLPNKTSYREPPHSSTKDLHRLF